jgi:eukaryotic-like serine/threonine-protein kinase
VTESDEAPRYRLDSRIATGGMGVVWRATDTVLDRHVAVKVLKAEYADDPEFRERFTAEARHAAALHHPNVASVFDFGELPPDDGSGSPRPFLVMELVPGQPLSALLRGGQPMRPESARDLVAQAADAVAAAHALDIVHRDIKPANLLVTPEGTVKITDFGIARAADTVGLTQTGQIVGTPQYISPEQAAGGSATQASDVYALGVVLYECLAGHRPFDADTPVTTALAHLRQPPPPLPGSVPAQLRAVVETALAKDPADRFGSAADLATAVRGGPVPDAAQPAAAAAVAATRDDQPAGLPQVGADTGVAGAGAAGAMAAAGAEPADDGTRVLTGAGSAPVPGRDGRDRPVLLPWLVAVVGVLIVVGVLAMLGRGAGEPDKAEQVSDSGSAEPSASASRNPSRVRVRADDYVGEPADEVQRQLEAKGLRVTRQAWANPGGQPAGTVAKLDPTGRLRPRTLVTLSVWQEPPPPEPETDEDHGHGDHGKDHGKSKGKDK